MSSTAQSDQASPRFSAQVWAAFWAEPQLTADAAGVLAPDIVGYWPGTAEPVRGLEAYVGKIADLLAAIPDLHLELLDSAAVAGDEPGEELIFLHYLGRGTGPDGPFEIRGVDRIRTRDGVVVENVIRYDPAELPWSPAEISAGD